MYCSMVKHDTYSVLMYFSISYKITCVEYHVNPNAVKVVEIQ